jgi:hypothetical protein
MPKIVGDIRRVVDRSEISDGEYFGVWSGYRLRFSTDSTTYEAETDKGVRGSNVHCMVRVKGGQIEITA